MQSSGSASFIKTPIKQTEKMSDDTPKEEVKEFADGKNEHDKIFCDKVYAIILW